MKIKELNIDVKKCLGFIILFFMIMVLLMVGCASVISEKTMEEVDRNVKFDQLLKNPDDYIGKTVLFGGSVIKTENLSGKTIIFVLQRPLEFRNKPTSKDISKGRFIITIPGFLDPEIYKAGRKVTVAGSVTGKDVRQLNKIDYTYPVIAKKEIYLWPEEGTYDDSPRFRFGVGVGIGL